MSRIVVVSTLLAALCLLGTIPHAAAARTATASEPLVVDVDATVPLFGTALSGTLTLDLTTSVATWAFTGTVAASAAQASGTGTSTTLPDGSLRLTLLTIDRWAMGPLPQPVLPATATLVFQGDTVQLRWDRLGITAEARVSPALAAQPEPGAHYAVTALPQTGTGADRPVATSGLALALFVLALLSGVAGWGLRPHRRPAN